MDVVHSNGIRLPALPNVYYRFDGFILTVNAIKSNGEPLTMTVRIRGWTELDLFRLVEVFATGVDAIAQTCDESRRAPNTRNAARLRMTRGASDHELHYPRSYWTVRPSTGAPFNLRRQQRPVWLTAMPAVPAVATPDETYQEIHRNCMLAHRAVERRTASLDGRREE